MKPPKSGRLFQESLRRRPFWMLVACQLVNQTTWEQARPALREVMRRYTIQNLSRLRPERLHHTLRPLGLWHRRSIILPAMARVWLEDRPRNREDVEKMVGCGRYAADSWSMFVEGKRPRGVRDDKLRWYLRRYSKQH